MIKLGSNVTDSISGFTGIATARCEYILPPSVSIRVETPMLHEGKPVDPQWFDEQRLGVNAEPIA